MARYIHIETGAVYNGRYVDADGVRYISPSASMLDKLGYEREEVTPTPADEAAAEIAALKAELAATDYIALKSVEGYDCDALYPGWKQQRAALRDRINELERYESDEELHA